MRCCDLLKFNYLCGRITNHMKMNIFVLLVVICSNLTTFVVESPTFPYMYCTYYCCDLLKFNYLCGRITNFNKYILIEINVVICSNLTTFVVESPTFPYMYCTYYCCDLLKFNYLCGRITNSEMIMLDLFVVVICSNLTTFVVESPTLYYLINSLIPQHYNLTLFISS